MALVAIELQTLVFEPDALTTRPPANHVFPSQKQTQLPRTSELHAACFQKKYNIEISGVIYFRLRFNSTPKDCISFPN